MAPTLLFGERLSEREQAVPALLPTNLNIREIAAVLFVSANTTKTQTRSIYRKLGVRTCADGAREPGLT